MLTRTISQLAIASLVLAACGRVGFGDSPDAGEREVTVGERLGASSGLVADTTIKDYEPGNNFVAADFLGAWAPLDGVDSTPGLVHFDLSAVSGSVLEATLELATHVELNATFDGETISAYALNEAWSPGEVTYNERSAGQSWSAPGANGAARGLQLASRQTDATSDRVVLSLGVDTVQQWLDTPDSNQGFILVVEANDGSGSWLASSEYGDLDRRPMLRLRMTE